VNIEEGTLFLEVPMQRQKEALEIQIMEGAATLVHEQEVHEAYNKDSF